MSDRSSADLQLPLPPGVLSALYFVLFDLVLLSFLDVVLARIVCSLYYRQIYRGRALYVKSVDIPGVTTFLLDQRFALPNILVLLIKLSLLACILLVDLNINSIVITSKTSHFRTGTFVFDPSDIRWQGKRSVAVGRQWEAMRNCHQINTSSAEIAYYALVFQLEGNVTVEEDLSEDYQDFVDVNTSTMVCLKPNNVLSEDVQVIAKVLGCSQNFGPTMCENGTRVYKETSVQSVTNPYPYDVVSWEAGSANVSVKVWHIASDVLSPLFPEYNSPNMTCSQSRIGPTETSKRFYTGCVLVDKVNGTTLIEQWRMDSQRQIMWRDYPGPVFDGDIDIGTIKRITLLENFFFDYDWKRYSGSIVADSGIYQQVPKSFTQLGQPEIVTSVPVYAIALAATLVGFSILLRVAVAFTVGEDSHPQFNTINGLSSIAREESEPTGRSFHTGQSMTIGVYHRNGHIAHFGPLRSKDECIRSSPQTQIF